MGDSPQQVPTNQASPGQYSSFSGSLAPWAKLLSQFQSGQGWQQQPSQQLSQQFSQQPSQQPSQQLSQQFQSGQSQPQQPQISPQAQAFLNPPAQQSYLDSRTMPMQSLPGQQAPQSQISNFFRFGSGGMM